jgi:hypothetical protein
MCAFQSLSEILRQAQNRYPALGKRIKEAEALGRWEASVGPIIAKHSRAIRIQDGVLWVEVDHPIWKSELHHRKRQILDLLNSGQNVQKPESSDKKEETALSDILFLDPRPNHPDRSPDRSTNQTSGRPALGSRYRSFSSKT